MTFLKLRIISKFFIWSTQWHSSVSMFTYVMPERIRRTQTLYLVVCPKSVPCPSGDCVPPCGSAVHIMQTPDVTYRTICFTTAERLLYIQQTYNNIRNLQILFQCGTVDLALCRSINLSSSSLYSFPLILIRIGDPSLCPCTPLFRASFVHWRPSLFSLLPPRWFRAYGNFWTSSLWNNRQYFMRMSVYRNSYVSETPHTQFFLYGELQVFKINYLFENECRQIYDANYYVDFFTCVSWV